MQRLKRFYKFCLSCWHCKVSLSAFLTSIERYFEAMNRDWASGTFRASNEQTMFKGLEWSCFATAHAFFISTASHNQAGNFSWSVNTLDDEAWFLISLCRSFITFKWLSKRMQELMEFESKHAVRSKLSTQKIFKNSRPWLFIKLWETLVTKQSWRSMFDDA